MLVPTVCTRYENKVAVWAFLRLWFWLCWSLGSGLLLAFAQSETSIKISSKMSIRYYLFGKGTNFTDSSSKKRSGLKTCMFASREKTANKNFKSQSDVKTKKVLFNKIPSHVRKEHFSSLYSYKWAIFIKSHIKNVYLLSKKGVGLNFITFTFISETI